MKWTAGEVLALADQHCSICFGLGQRASYHGKQAVCHCVYRQVFRHCLLKFQHFARHEGQISQVSLESAGTSHTHGRRHIWGMRHQEYMADFVLTVRRALGAESCQYAVFRFHHLLGGDWHLCVNRLAALGFASNRGEFFHEVYRLESKAGKALGSVEPYALFPTDQYFASTPGKATASLLALELAVGHHENAGDPARLRYPLKTRTAGTTEA